MPHVNNTCGMFFYCQIIIVLYNAACQYQPKAKALTAITEKADKPICLKIQRHAPHRQTKV